ncbi:hypothetical protein F5Y12DRAFT_644711 [Xylaria sp. FL1777]|nr:hypothetical protein F5Y12DRAFT_644711 [Xylaria sp. FL1777]
MAEENSPTRPFRVIIVGAGLLGLTAAHMFAKTDIDFVVLEQHDNLMPEIGSLLSLLPHTFRLLDQLGIMDAVLPIAERVDLGVLMSAYDGSIWNEERFSQILETNHGHGVRIVHRPHYVQALFKSLPKSAQPRVHVRKRVVRIEVTADGVAVHCADGTVEHGSMVIGADGVHSRTRQAMQTLAAGSLLPADAPQTQPSPYTTTYRLLFGNLPLLPGLSPNTNHEGAADGVSTQLLTGTQRAWFAVYEKIAVPTSERLRWSEADKLALLEKWGHLHVAPGYTLEDVNLVRNGPVGLINLEEGLVDTWWWKRIVLVGDAVRKLEPHAGLGYNTGVSDLVDLVNRLRHLTRGRTDSSSSSAPGVVVTTEDLEAVFRAYQKKRMEDTPAIISMSEKRARMCAWLSTSDWIMARFLVPWLPLAEYSVNHILGPIICRAPVLDWLPEKQLPARAMPYVHHPRLETKEKVSYSNGTTLSATSVSRLPLLTGTLVLAALATVGFRLYRRI